MYISEYKNKRVYLGTVKFKTKDYEYLGTLLIFTQIPLVPKKGGLLRSVFFIWYDAFSFFIMHFMIFDLTFGVFEII